MDDARSREHPPERTPRSFDLKVGRHQKNKPLCPGANASDGREDTGEKASGRESFPFLYLSDEAEKGRSLEPHPQPPTRDFG